MNIGIIGYGVVGKAAENTLKEGYKVFKYDKFQKLDDFRNIEKCDIVFIMVPTPFDCSKNKVDDSAIIENLSKLSSSQYKGLIIIKSTVPPGSCEKYSKDFDLNISFNPEFLRESTTPNEDFKNQDTIVIGTANLNDFNLIKKMYEKVSVPHAKYFKTTTKEAEMIKCAQNTMLASRVALANLIYDACKNNNIKYNKVKEIAFDRFKIIGPHMTLVPGPDGERGFGGKCLPKDIRAFSTVYNSKLLQEIIAYNDTLRDDLSNFLDNFGELNDK